MAVTFARIGVMFGKMRTSGRPEPHRNRKVPLAKKSEQQTEAGLLLYPKNRVLCRLGDSEFDDGLGGNLHLLLRLGIEARACFPLLLHQLAKTGQDEFTVLLDLFVCERAERIEEYACGFFCWSRSRSRVRLEVHSWSSNFGFMAAELHHFKKIAQGLIPCFNPHRRVPLR